MRSARTPATKLEHKDGTMFEKRLKKIAGRSHSSRESDKMAEYISRQAGIMEQGGWTRQATDLRKWASELRGRTSENAFRC